MLRVDEPQKHDAHETSQTKAHMMYDSTDMKCPEQANPETGSRLVVARDWGRVDGE